MHFVVIGGGICGLVAALNLRNRHPDAEISVIERNKDLGGLLAGTEYVDEGLYFDQGTHIPRETGNAEIDAFLVQSIPENDRIHFKRGHGDVAGSVFNGRLQENSHFPDIRGCDDYGPLHESLLKDERNSVSMFEREKSAISQAYNKFGTRYSEQILAPILQHLYLRPTEDLSWFAMELPGLTRVVANDLDGWKTLENDDQKRALFAIPDQRLLPDEYISPKRSFYTMRKGTKTFIDSLVQSLKAKDIKFLCGVTITQINLEHKMVSIQDADKKEHSLRSDAIVIATGVMGAAHMLGVDISSFGFDRPMPHRLINLVAKDIKDTDLCYFYGLDEAVDFYRVTHYAGITGNKNDKRLTVEILGDRAPDDAALTDLIVGQLYDIGFLRSRDISFSSVQKIGMGFPVPTVKNMHAMRDVSAQVQSKLLDGIVLGGIGAGEGLFFQNEIIAHIIQETDLL